MATSANRNVILSAGGKHGSAAGTYLQNQVVPARALAHVPDRLLSESPGGTNPGKHGSAPADSRKTKAPTAQAPAAKAKAEAKIPAHVPGHRVVETPKAIGPDSPDRRESAETPEDPAPTSTAQEAPAAPVPLSDYEQRAQDEEDGLFDPDEPVATEIETPTSKRALSRMSKADAYALAVELALDVPENPDNIKSSDLKRKLAADLGL